MNNYIYSISSVSNQESFENPGFSKTIVPFSQQKELIQPNYKEFIPAIKLRRMPKLSRMAIAATLSALKLAELENVGAIIAASGLGSLDDTERFLQKYIPAGESLVPPVSFIQSGHNTVSGQIALFLNNNSYNMTHVQQNVSFEHALIDSLMFIDENETEVLLGGMDENIPLLKELATLFDLDNSTKENLSEGCTFMIVGRDKEKAIAQVIDVEVNVSPLSVNEKVIRFLKKNKLQISDIDQVLIGSGLNFNYQDRPSVNTVLYTDYCGQYLTSSAFGCHLAVDMIANADRKKVLCINGMGDNLGLTLFSNV